MEPLRDGDCGHMLLSPAELHVPSICDQLLGSPPPSRQKEERNMSTFSCALTLKRMHALELKIFTENYVP